MKRVERIHGGRVVIGALTIATPVAHDQLHIQKPALYFGRASLDTFNRCGTKGHGRQAGHAGKAFLRSGIHRIGTPFIDAEINAT